MGTKPCSRCGILSLFWGPHVIILSEYRHEGRLPPKHRRVGSSILDRGGVPGVPAEAALVGGVRVPALWGTGASALAASLEAFVEEAIQPSSLVDTDAWEGYAGLENKGYRHEVTVLRGKRQLASKLLSRVHRVASLLKRWPGGNAFLDYRFPSRTGGHNPAACAVSASRPVKSGQSSPGHRRPLAGRTAAVCLAAACVLLTLPAIAFAQTPAVPEGLTATSGAGTMTLNWNRADDANAGYDYRYTTIATQLTRRTFLSATPRTRPRNTPAPKSRKPRLLRAC